MKINFTAISVFVSALIISNQLKTNDNLTPESVEYKEQLTYTKQLLTKEEIAIYLGITTQEFEELDKRQIAVVGRGIPFLTSGNTEYYTIQGIEKWLSDINYYQSNDILGNVRWLVISLEQNLSISYPTKTFI